MSVEEKWAETFAALFLLTGFVISLLLVNPILLYITVFLSGFLAGRIFYIKRYTEPIFPFILMICGFLFGYMIGAIWASRIVTGLLFITGFTISYYIHFKKFILKT